jgi:hypothetical protein
MEELATALARKNPPKIIPLRCELNKEGKDNPTVPNEEQWPDVKEPELGAGQKLDDAAKAAEAGAAAAAADPQADPVEAAELAARAKALNKWQRRKLVQDEMDKINSTPSRGVMAMDRDAEGMNSVSAVANEVLEVLTESMNAWEKKGYMARLKGSKVREKLLKEEGGVRKTNALDKEIYFASGRNLMPWKKGKESGNTEVGIENVFANPTEVIALLEEGADPSKYGELGCRAIHWATGKQCDDCALALIGGGADIQKQGLMMQSGLLITGAVSFVPPLLLLSLLLACRRIVAPSSTTTQPHYRPLPPPPQTCSRRTPLDLALRPMGHGIIPKSQPIIDMLKERGACCGCKKKSCELGENCAKGLPVVDVEIPIEDIEDEDLRTWLQAEKFDDAQYNMFVKKRPGWKPAKVPEDYPGFTPISLQTLMSMAGRGQESLEQDLENLFPDLNLANRKTIAKKAFEDSLKGKLSPDEIRYTRR